MASVAVEDEEWDDAIWRLLEVLRFQWTVNPSKHHRLVNPCRLQTMILIIGGECANSRCSMRPPGLPLKTTTAGCTVLSAAIVNATAEPSQGCPDYAGWCNVGAYGRSYH